ncbi:hypothetical protein [Mycolicibacter longobardus]|uniref:Uncharacterized protein n=1 Tax=Mycolicibacter longobardus TaxID=1108812 RepID=A0A1X1YE02_9MYCO|nr:hypothetical protein [Mycolicibacter longobardus]MCV7385391.1 hypothetical protein [Mycolicibacter longobardus]ORW09296.1 hypothetical protein AWC16_17115 [Mycolicibacter longobardus]
MTISGGRGAVVVVTEPVVVLGAVVLLGGSVVVGGSVVLAVVVGDSVVVGGAVVDGSGVVAGGGFSSVGVFGATGCGLGGIDSSVGATVVDEVVDGAVEPESWCTSRTMPQTSSAISSAVSTPKPISATGRRYQGVGGGGSDQRGCCPVGSRYSL